MELVVVVTATLGLPARRGLSQALHSTAQASFWKVQARQAQPSLGAAAEEEAAAGAGLARGLSQAPHSTARPSFTRPQLAQAQGPRDPGTAPSSDKRLSGLDAGTQLGCSMLRLRQANPGL
eukprot:g16419.t1